MAQTKTHIERDGGKTLCGILYRGLAHVTAREAWQVSRATLCARCASMQRHREKQEAARERARRRAVQPQSLRRFGEE